LRIFDPIVLRQFEKASGPERHLVKITVSTTKTLRWTDADRDIFFDSAWWKVRNFRLSDVQQSISGESQTMTMTVDNVSREWSKLALATDLRGCAIVAYTVALDRNLAVIGATTEAGLAPGIYFIGEIDQMTPNLKTSAVTCVTESVKARRTTPGECYSPTCRHPFPPTAQRPECGYAGAATWCDHSWARCTALANTDNYGGEPEMADLANKEFRWGSKGSGWR
jgi:hypothetical protein